MSKLPDVKSKLTWPMAFMLVAFALTRVPGMLPNNFSAVYALVFCGGVFFSNRMTLWPLGVMVVTDIGLNFFYWIDGGLEVWKPLSLVYLGCNYAAYLVLFWLGRSFKPQSSFTSLLGGGIAGAVLFYLITNTASWIFNPYHNPEYTKTLHGLLRALTLGTAGWPETWQFFRNTLLSGGLFTGLFVGAMKLNESAAESKQETEEAKEPEETPEGQPEEAKA